jgi:hypothetical protein
VPRQNRVNPLGEIVVVPDRGLLMGNRGCLHDAQGAIRRAWQLERWIVCLLKFKDRKHQVMMPGHYTELFFLDEATALAAGTAPAPSVGEGGLTPSAGRSRLTTSRCCRQWKLTTNFIRSGLPRIARSGPTPRTSTSCWTAYSSCCRTRRELRIWFWVTRS